MKNKLKLYRKLHNIFASIGLILIPIFIALFAYGQNIEAIICLVASIGLLSFADELNQQQP